jgi:replication initiation protein RepC
MDSGMLAATLQALRGLRRDADTLFARLDNIQKMNGNDAEPERQESDSKTDSADLEPAFKKSGRGTEAKTANPAGPAGLAQSLTPTMAGPGENGPTGEAPQTSGAKPGAVLKSGIPATGPAGSKPAPRNGPAMPGEAPPLGAVLRACPHVQDFSQTGIRSWRDMVATADFVRPMLGVSPSAWQEAKQAMGAEKAAATLAAILERSEDIRSPGGYLRSLTAKAEKGEFSLWPMLMALGKERRAGRGDKASNHDG